MFRPSMLGRYIPEGSRLIKPLDLDAWVYLYERQNQATGKYQFLAIAYSGKATNNSFHIQFSSDERRREHVQQWIQGQRERAERKAKEMQERREFKHSLKVNDILHSSWGYDQTNNDFWQVVEVRGKSVMVRPIGKMTIEETGFMSAKVQPIPGEFTGEPELKRVCFGNYVKFDNQHAWLWCGKPVYESYYA